jgi:hypothetical protein
MSNIGNDNVIEVFTAGGKRLTYIGCFECGEEVACEVITDELGSFVDITSTCPHCNAEFAGEGDCDYREDFCAGT